MMSLSTNRPNALNPPTFDNGGKFHAGTEFGAVGQQGTALFWANQYYTATSGQAAWLKTSATGGQSQMTAVPEPASLCALAIGGAALLRRRRACRG